MAEHELFIYIPNSLVACGFSGSRSAATATGYHCSAQLKLSCNDEAPYFCAMPQTSTLTKILQDSLPVSVVGVPKHQPVDLW